MLRGLGDHQNISLINPEQNCVPIVKITISSEGRERKGACQGLLRFSVLFNVGDDIKGVKSRMFSLIERDTTTTVMES